MSGLSIVIVLLQLLGWTFITKSFGLQEINFVGVCPTPRQE